MVGMHIRIATTRAARGFHSLRWGALPIVAALVLCVTSLLASPRAVSAQTAATEIFARVAPSVPVVETPRGHGTGFMFDATHVMTDAHVVEDFDTVKIRFPDGATYGNAKVVVRDRLVDMAIIEIQGTREVATQIVPPPTVVGSELYVLGYPGRTNNSPQPVFSRGLVSQVTTWESAGMTYLRTDASGGPGVSGGPVLDSAGNVVGVIQFGSSSGAYMIAASAADLKARATRHLRGENVDGITKRVPGGPSAFSFDVRLTGAPHPEESFFFTATTATTGQFSLDASRLGGSMTATLYTATGTWVGGTVLTGSRRSATIGAPLVAGERYWFSVASESAVRINLRSNVLITRLDDGDDGRASAGRVVGLLDHGSDTDCRPIAMRVGQVLTARVESVTAAPTLYIASPGGAMIAGDEDTGEGVRGNDAKATATTASNGDFVVCVGAAVPVTQPAGYILTLETTPPTQPDASAGTFVISPARLAAPRHGSATVALRDGRVMIIDGLDENGALLSTAEIFDPAKGTVVTAPTRDVVARRDPSAVLLTDGRVLIIGGITSSGVTDAASVYNPTDGSWSAVTSLGAPRLGAEAIVLDDGRVLVVTGTGTFAPLASAEIFDPATGRFSVIGSMTVARSGLIASKLADGRVLIAGGVDATQRLNRSAEIYDPKTGRFTATGDLVAARYNHSSTLLSSGLVLITGGTTPWDDLASAELYDPKTGTFRATESMQFAREGHTSTLLADDRVLIAGGVVRAGLTRTVAVEIGAVELYDPAAGRFVPAGALLNPRGQSAVSLPDGTVVLMGGTTEFGPLDSIESYRPAAVAPRGAGTFLAPPVFSASGIALVIFAGGNTDQLEAVARAAGATGVWVQDVDGAPRLLVVGGPTFLNETFRAAFARGLGSSTVLMLTR